VVKTKSRQVFVITADFTATAFYLDQLCFTLITSTLLGNVILMFIIDVG